MFFDRPNSGERTVLVHVVFKGDNHSLDEQEFSELAESAGALRVAEILSKRASPTPTYLVGRGKLEEIQHAVLTQNADLVIFNRTLAGTRTKSREGTQMSSARSNQFDIGYFCAEGPKS